MDYTKSLYIASYTNINMKVLQNSCSYIALSSYMHVYVNYLLHGLWTRSFTDPTVKNVHESCRHKNELTIRTRHPNIQLLLAS